jgi:competence protein ComEA
MCLLCSSGSPLSLKVESWTVFFLPAIVAGVHHFCGFPVTSAWCGHECGKEKGQIEMKLGRFACALLLALTTISFSTMPAVAWQSAPAVKAPADASATGQLDINSASKDQLMALPGVGTTYAQKIIDGRPYASKNQLRSRNIIPQSVYQKISGMIIAKQPPKTSK